MRQYIFCALLFAMSAKGISKAIFVGTVSGYDNNGPTISIEKKNGTHTPVGTDLKIQRKHQGRLITTGHAQVISIKNNEILAKVDKDGTRGSIAHLAPYGGIMMQDIVHKVTKDIHLAREIFPHISLAYEDIFMDPLRLPQTYELSKSGMKKVEDAAARLKHFRVENLIVKGFTDDQGSPEANQVESFQRAATIRQYLVDQLGFDPERVVALGFGELEHADLSHVGKHRSRNRRITFSIIRGCANCQASR